MSALYPFVVCFALVRLLATSVAACTGGASEVTEPAANRSTVRIITQREGENIRVLVDNREACEVTVTLELRVVNLVSDQPLPLVKTFPARRVTDALVLRAEKPGTTWEYSYTNYYKLGSRDARHDDSQSYFLPYLPGYRFKVTQAYNGSYSHTGSNRYAVDWKMPEGTIVCAARAGEVVKAKSDSDTGGPSPKFDSFNNYVLIRHDDGTLGHYCHLQQDGVMVKVGERVVAGQPIAMSGNTGFSSGPHLHFCVFRTRSGRQRDSVPVKFRTADALAVTLRESGLYRAAQIPLPMPAPLGHVAGQPESTEGEGRGS